MAVFYSDLNGNYVKFKDEDSVDASAIPEGFVKVTFDAKGEPVKAGGKTTSTTTNGTGK